MTGVQALAAAETANSAAEAAAVDVEAALVVSTAARGRQLNLTYFAFTATPKSKASKMFSQPITDASGETRFVPFHLYSIRQVIAEGLILD